MDPSAGRCAAPPPPYTGSNNNSFNDKKLPPIQQQNAPPFLSSPSSSLQPPPSHTKLACLSLHMSDRIRLLNFHPLNFHPEHIRIITDVVRANAVKGVQDVRLYDQSTEIKLAGYPWISGGYRPLPEDRVGAIKVMIAMLKTLYDLGWVVQFASDIWRKGSLDKDSLIMRYTHNIPPPRPTSHWLGVSFDSSNLLSIVNAPPSLGAAVATHFGDDKVSSHKPAFPGEKREYYEIKFRGHPWRPSGTEAVKSRLLILGLLEVLEEHAFRLYTAIDQGDSEGSGSDTWYCCRDEDWVEGMTV
ncbi:hypothetical protein TMatcc_006015 [Talaromyces marneffei ATCC 18224]